MPRSYIGYNSKNDRKRLWGTGQYKIDMTVSESCDINYDYYVDMPRAAGKDARMNRMAPDAMVVAANVGQRPGGGAQATAHALKTGKWNRHWTEEWNLMKKRRKGRNFFQGILDSFKVNYGNFRWVYTLLDPVATVILADETKYLTKWTGQLFGLDDTPAAAAKGANANASVKPAGNTGGNPGVGQGGAPGSGQQPPK